MKKLNVKKLYEQLLKQIYENKITKFTTENFYLIKRHGHLKQYHTFEQFKKLVESQITQIQQTNETNRTEDTTTRENKNMG